MSGLIDSHCHLAHLDGDPSEVISRAEEAGVVGVVDIAMGTSEARVSVRRAEEMPGVVHACVGVHPNDLREYDADRDATLQTLRELASSPAVVGIGETGLDHYRDRSSPDLQEEAFRAHIALAKEVGRTLVIHCRDAHDRVLAVLDDAGAPDRVVMHCFSGDVAHSRQCAERGFLCSFAGNLTYKKNDELREVARTLPAELILIETDAPYLAPMPFRGKPNAPHLLTHTAAVLAEVRSTTVQHVGDLTADNTRRAFVI